MGAASSNLKMARDNHARDWLGALRDAYAIHNIVALRPELPFWVIRWDGGDASSTGWSSPIPASGSSRSTSRSTSARTTLRDRHYLDGARRGAARPTRLVRKELLGFWDLFYALPDDEERRTFLYAGQFYRAQPDWESLTAQWRELSGLEPASANPDFVGLRAHGARACRCSRSRCWRRCESFMKLYAAFLTERYGEGPRIQQAVDALNRDYFSNLWPIEDWIDSALSSDKFQLTPWHHEGKPDRLDEGGAGHRAAAHHGAWR